MIREIIMFPLFFSFSPVPSRPPLNVSGRGLTSTSLYVSWNPVPMQYRSGIILGYNVSYWRATENRTANITLTTEKGEIEIDGLEILASYMVAVSAFNKIGNGDFSDPVEIWTGESGR